MPFICAIRFLNSNFVLDLFKKKKSGFEDVNIVAVAKQSIKIIIGVKCSFEKGSRICLLIRDPRAKKNKIKNYG